ncbi:MAG: NADH:flavin oxidoreductase/NADH oxidase [Candidatus Thiodiazotropha sp. (ex Ctena orbiculata)]|uniref:NADH:flavin oxidoreductase/NADH oxidase n=1 Tax=Candidatus Thiodiazotropha taylori TaxID=2792791 RepID=A0A944QWH5_9GAMM|nr:NADH:flavin oxidoreductase/NADH oxidase [Candidatus Thiodiazotropha taylori]MBV2136689.1 NADH:flavin oxidoreductase/NADH oxidase [Candidatus Thiodiazotropha taylori]
MSRLFTPFALGRQDLENRIVIAPMCQYSALEGKATDWHLIHLGHLALSGAALLYIEATAVTPQGRISPNDLGLWSDETEDALGRVIKGIRGYSDMPIAIQLAHAGRKASTAVPWKAGGQLLLGQDGWQTCAPSPLPWSEEERPPAALDPQSMGEIRRAFVTAAARAHRLGIEVIEIHAAHGYLLHQFLSPLANRRDDSYGGSLENRLRFPLEVFEAVREALPPEVPLGIRISATDWVEGGWDMEQSLALAQALKQRDCAFIHVSSGGLSPLQQIPAAPSFQVPFAARIRHECGLPTIAVGLITEPAQAEEIVASEQADLVALARGILYNPRWPWHAAAALGDQVTAPPQYWRSPPHGSDSLFKS